MIINETDKKVNIKLTDLVFAACRKREAFQRFDKALKDDPAFVKSLVEREEKKAGNVYYPEANISCSLKIEEFILELSGIPSVLVKDEFYTVDIVKSMRYPLKFVTQDFIHLWNSEGKILAFILAKKHKLEKINVRISVFHTETLERKIFDSEYSYSELDTFFKNTLSEFLYFFITNAKHVIERNEKADKAGFPFPSSRDGQKQISKEVFSAIKNKSNAIINAPTGLGKTVSTIYPSLKAQGRGLCDKIFYVTAKNSGNDSVLDAIKLFENAGYDITVTVITAKSRICDKHPCSPKNCAFSKGHHERLMSAVRDVTSSSKVYTSEIIKLYSEKYNVCPFMLGTELVWFADLVICDYNYIFDPDVSSKISASLSGNDVVLVDEAHNIVDRLRNIFSAEIKLSRLRELYEMNGTNTEAKKTLKNFLNFVKSDIEDNDFACEPIASGSLDALERELNELFSKLQEHIDDKNGDAGALIDSIKKFVDLLTIRSSDYITFYNDAGDPEIFMVNTAQTIFRRSKELGSVILFSATLFPEEYYKYMLGAREKDVYVSFPSPFNSKNLLVLCYPLSTKYSEREQTADDVARAIWTAGSTKTGNYISFFPSYKYMEMVLNSFVRLFHEERVIYQTPSMSDDEKKSFLSSFVPQPKRSLFAFAVLGGSFSEGIDLTGDKLSGAVVVGLGSLPPSRKGVMMSGYFTDEFFDGDKFAYHYPGLNKVFQAGGRVIRSESDKGFLMIIDDRFLTEENIELLPSNWTNIKKVKDNNSISSYLGDFWRNL